MKKAFPLSFFALLLIIACQQKNVLQVNEVSTALTPLVAQIKPPQSPLNEFEKFVSHLDSAEVSSISEAAQEYASLFKEKPVALADSGYVIFEKFYQRVDKTINKTHQSSSTDFNLVLASNAPSAPQQTQKFKEYNQTLQENGFEVASKEEGTYLKQNRAFIATHFYPFISPTLKEYLEQVNKETREGFAEDGSLTIIEEELVSRVIWWEGFVAKHPSFIYTEESKARKKYYLTVLLEGLVNTPVLSLERKNKIDTYFAVAYQELYKCAPQSEANKLVQPYFKALLRPDKTQAYALLKQYRQAGVIIDSSEPKSEHMLSRNGSQGEPLTD
ncbi:hypothetical protein [Rufibacter tibetensis]|uniref:Uncharacterized protein n=1 Tax=Rufibacter tibetensis TaxID=512763 RepID=A0A0P0CXF7_9BACT|nr:hypothetical protein [Rufibacter tibetensis]ALI99085.1 hypothetical protein DC20_08995 [Rufibacter tibetensis]